MVLTIYYALIGLLAVIQVAAYIPNVQTLHLSYNGRPMHPGANLTIPETVDPPTVSADNLPENKAVTTIEARSIPKTFLLLLIDPDVVHNKTATTMLHWYQPNLVRDKPSTSSTSPPDKGQTLHNTTDNGARYLGPHPPKGTRHRYIFLLYVQPAGYIFPSCFDRIFRDNPQLSRAGFDVRQFQEAAKLNPPIALTYLFVANGEPVGKNPVATTTSLDRAPCGGPPTGAPPKGGTGVGGRGVMGQVPLTTGV